MARWRPAVNRTPADSEAKAVLFHRHTDAPSIGIQPKPIGLAPRGLAKQPKIVIVGSGMAGLVSAMFLARRGFRVHVFEKRENRSSCVPTKGRSMNLTLCERGLKILDELGIRSQILLHAVRLNGRAIHLPTGTVKLHDYGNAEREILHAIRRFDLNSALMKAAQQYPNLQIHSAQTCTSIDKEQKVATFLDGKARSTIQEKYDLLIGADGVFSKVRAHMSAGENTQFSEHYSKWCYKEFTLDATNPVSLQISRLHVWARKNLLLVAIPNSDRTFTCNLFLPVEAVNQLGELDSARAFLETNFSDLLPVAKDIASTLSKNPVNKMVSIRTNQWHFDDSIALVGDASHGVLPFLGQGVNSAFEDCSALDKCLTPDPAHWKAALKKYEDLRRPNADALSVLVDQHLMVLQGHTGTNLFGWKDFFTKTIARLTLNRVLPIYSLIAHTDVPYTDILRRLNFQSRLFAFARPFVLIAPLLIYAGLHLWGML